jgi:predicted DNA-binding transcriptional regulator YafY
MKASRLLSILMLLQARGRLTAPALAELMEVSVRTILRDIDQLSAAGVPLWGERGRLGGFQLREGWSTALTGMTEPEANALLLAGLPAAATELGLGSAAASARLKLVASLPAIWREQAERVGERLHIDPVDWYRAQDTPHRLRDVADAVWHNKRVVLRYESWHGLARHELEPLGLVLKAGAWYLAARKVGAAAREDAVRTFRLASVRDLEVGTQTFKRPRHFDLAAYWAESLRRFEQQLHPLQAHIRISPRGVNWLVHGRIKFSAVPIQPGRPGTGKSAGASRAGWSEVLLPIESVEHGARQLLGYAAEVEVIAPVALRKQLVRELQRMTALYADSATATASRR